MPDEVRIVTCPPTRRVDHVVLVEDVAQDVADHVAQVGASKLRLDGAARLVARRLRRRRGRRPATGRCTRTPVPLNSLTRSGESPRRSARARRCRRAQASGPRAAATGAPARRRAPASPAAASAHPASASASARDGDERRGATARRDGVRIGSGLRGVGGVIEGSFFGSSSVHRLAGAACAGRRRARRRLAASLVPAPCGAPARRPAGLGCARGAAARRARCRPRRSVRRAAAPGAAAAGARPAPAARARPAPPCACAAAARGRPRRTGGGDGRVCDRRGLRALRRP